MLSTKYKTGKGLGPRGAPKTWVERTKGPAFYHPNEVESATNSPADDYLCEECLRCHLYGYEAERFGDYRASGCAACHLLYDNNGKNRGP